MLIPEELVTLTAKRLGLPREQVRIVMLDFFNTIKTALQQPHESFIRGIKIYKCCKWTLNPKKVVGKYVLYRDKFPHTRTFQKLNILNQNFLENEVYTKKQQEYQQKCQRLDTPESNECGTDDQTPQE